MAGESAPASASAPDSFSAGAAAAAAAPEPANAAHEGEIDDSLTAAQRDAVATYRAVTESASHASAVAALTAADWNVQDAVETFLSGSTPPASAAAPAAAPAPAPAAPMAVARPRAARTRPRWLLALLSPLRFLWALVRRLQTLATRMLGGPAAALALSPGETPAARFRAFFEDRHGDAHPTFFDGSYAAALAAAQAQTRFLLVYLHSEGHADTAPFCARVIADAAFIAAADADFVVWAGAVSQRDGAAAQHALRAPGFPFLAVVNPPRATVRVADGLPPMGAAHFGRVVSARGAPIVANMDAPAVVAWLADVRRRYGGLLDSVRETRAARERDRRIIEEQNLEFAQSLEADRAREREAREVEGRRMREENAVKEREERRRRKKDALGEEVESGPGVCKVMLRLPDGTRVNRRFGQEEVLEKVFDWAEVNCVDIEVACLVTNYPRKSFRYPEDAGLSLKEAGLFPSAMLLLEERGDAE